MKYEDFQRVKSVLCNKLIVMAFIIYFINVYIKYKSHSGDIILRYGKAMLQKAVYDFKITKAHRKRNQTKFILFWSPILPPEEFTENNCLKLNCNFTMDKTFFGRNLKRFDAIIFDGIPLNTLPQNKLPHERSPHQKYIFFNTESASNYPVKSDRYNGYFNWTATYRLDSDIVVDYMTIKNIEGNVIGPKIDMKWIKPTEDVDDSLKIKLRSKRFAAAWFVSNCYTESRREILVANLKKELKKYNLNVHIYGFCGDMQCPRSEETKCNAILEKDYYFYLSFENSFDKDYVTEKLLTALQHDAVPIVYGGANYSRFLPPGSYIDARKMSVKMLAFLMDKLIKNPNLYHKYFTWKRYYTYAIKRNEFLCDLCSVLNDKKFKEYSSYDNFLHWWNKNTS